MPRRSRVLVASAAGLLATCEQGGRCGLSEPTAGRDDPASACRRADERLRMLEVETVPGSGSELHPVARRSLAGLSS